MTALKGGTPKPRGKANIGVGAASAALAVGMLFNASPAQAASVIDLPGQGTNTIQLNGGGDVFQPQFALWPLPGRTTATTYEWPTTPPGGARSHRSVMAAGLRLR